MVGDISKKDETIRLSKELDGKEPNGIQLLVNNAGIARDDDTKFSKCIISIAVTGLKAGVVSLTTSFSGKW